MRMRRSGSRSIAAPRPAAPPRCRFFRLRPRNGGTLAAAKAADVAERVASLDWSARADGAYFLRVVDSRLGAAGGPDFIYSLSLATGRPDFSLAAKTDFVNSVQDGRGEIELAIVRRGGFAGPIDLAVEGLPEGVTIEPKQIAAGQTSLKLAFVAAADAPRRPPRQDRWHRGDRRKAAHSHRFRVTPRA